jgi:Domain of unknown function (DUF4177)
VTFEYKCVAGPTIVAVKNAKARDQSVKAFEDIMNREAAEGWEFVGIDEFHVSEPVGLFTSKRVYVPSKILVFRRSKATPAPVTVVTAPVAAAPVLSPPPPMPPPMPPSHASSSTVTSEEAKPSIKAIADHLTAARKDRV